MSWLSTRRTCYVSKQRYAQCSQPTQRKPQRGGGRRPPPFVEAAETRLLCVGLAVNTGHILGLRRKTCALLRAKTSALLRRKTCAVLRARTCALFRVNAKETTEGGGRRPPPLHWRCTRHMSCPRSQHSTSLASQQGRCLASVFTANRKETTEGGGRRPPPSVVAAEGRHLCIGAEHGTCHVLVLNTAQVLRLNKADVLALNKAHVLRLNIKICPEFTALRYTQCTQPTQRKPQRGGGARRPSPFVEAPKTTSFVLAVNTGHILMLRRKTCAMLRAKTPALLRRMACAVLRARTCALFRVNTKVPIQGRARPSAHVIRAWV